MLKHSKTVCACRKVDFSEFSLFETLSSAALQVDLHAASPALGMLLLACQLPLQFPVPLLKTELLKFCLLPRCPCSRHWGEDCRSSPVVLQLDLSYSSISGTRAQSCWHLCPDADI